MHMWLQSNDGYIVSSKFWLNLKLDNDICMQIIKFLPHLCHYKT